MRKSVLRENIGLGFVQLKPTEEYASGRSLPGTSTRTSSPLPVQSSMTSAPLAMTDSVQTQEEGQVIETAVWDGEGEQSIGFTDEAPKSTEDKPDELRLIMTNFLEESRAKDSLGKSNHRSEALAKHSTNEDQIDN